MTYQLHVGRCEEVLKTLPDNSVDAIVTDPPYGLSFMNHKWDYDVPTVDQWRECLRVLKPVDTCWRLADHGPITDLSLTLRMLASKSGTKSYGFTVADSLSHTTSMVILMAGERR